MKKWLSNIKIPAKLNVMLGVSLLSLLLLGLVSNYFFKTSNVVAFILKAERIHNVQFHYGIQQFYTYLTTNEASDLEDAYAHLDTANHMSEVFSKLKYYKESKTEQELADILYEIMAEAVQYDYSRAELIADRLSLMLSINNKQLNRGLELARDATVNGKNIKAQIQQYVQDPSPELMDKLKAGVKKMVVFEKQFANAINDINDLVMKLLVWGIVIIVLLLGGITFLLSRFIASTIKRPVSNLMKTVEGIAKGDLSREVKVGSGDEIGELGKSVGKMRNMFVRVTEQANTIAEGDYSTNIEPRSPADTLGIALRKMTESLRQASELNKRENWLKTGQNELNEKLRGDQDIRKLSSQVISYLVKYINAQVGALYLYDEHEEILTLTGSYAFTRRKSLSNKFKIGEGLVGQAAYEREIISISDLPEDYTRIESAIGNTMPRNLVLAPFEYNDKLLGVVEIGSLQELDHNQMEFLQSVLENIAIAVTSAQSRDRLKELLEKTQQQAEELQNQQEELRVTNEELEEQTKALKKSEQELQEQQEELRVTNEELEEKTHSLEEQRGEILKKNDELESAREAIEKKAKELEVTSRYKSEFLANMSHELRTPLNSLMVLSRNLASNKQGNLTEDQLESANIIHKSGNDLLNLINEILDLSKIESGKMTIHIEEVSLEEIGNNLQRNFTHVAEEKGLEFSVNIDDELPAYIKTDRYRLDQILKNLLSNALKFTREGGVYVKMEKVDKSNRPKRSKLNPENSFRISVLDTGIGIPANKKAEIFEAFQQVDGSISRKYGGTGLGLSISRELTRLLGGEIHLESEEGKGSSFSIYLPFEHEQDEYISENADIKGRQKAYNEKVVEARPDTTFTPTKTASPKKTTKKSSLTFINDDRKNIKQTDKVILVIEDDPNFARTLCKLCHEKDFKCLAVPTGEEGLEAAMEYKIDAIILDIKLPGMDGMEVLDELKNNTETLHIPVHVMSAMEETIDAFKRGAIGYLTKPVNPDKLESAFTKIEDYIDRKVKDLLVIEDDKNMRTMIRKLIGNGDVQVTDVGSGKEALDRLQSESYDCIVLDLGLPDMTGFELLSKLDNQKDLEIPPVIVYTGKELTREENKELQKYTNSIIIKGVKSEERLLDETALFLHRVVGNLPETQKQIIADLHDKEKIFSGKNILLVDDDMRNVFALSKVLEEKGMQIKEAENGKVALDILKKDQDFDLILMDIMMPEMDGYEAIRQIRKLNNVNKIPILALTAKAMKEDRDKCLAAGANDYITKPVQIEKLLSLMRVWMHR